MPLEAWSAGFDAALRVENWDAAVRELQMLAERWPAELSTYNDDAIFRTIAGARKVEKGAERRYALLDVLYDTGWKPSDPGATMDRLWADLAAGLTEHGLTIRATRVVQGVRHPWTLAYMRADKRFDGLFDHTSPDFDPEVQSPIELESSRKLVVDHPDKLAYVTDYAYDLLLHRHPEAALKLLDGARARIAAATKDKPAYADLETKGVWLKDYRRRALMELGRDDEALSLAIEASGDKEEGGDNVSQVINLAGIYDDLGRPKDALDTLTRLKGAANLLKGGASPYGLMQAESVRAIAYVQLGDKQGLATSMAYLKSHEADAPGALFEPMMWAGDLDAVAAIYIDRLNDPEQRLAALGDLQEFAQPLHPTPAGVTLHQRWDALRARADMQAAIAKVGRINRYSFLE
jgi:hypothetical protein